MKALFSLLVVACSTVFSSAQAQEPAAKEEVIALPFTGRKNDVAFARELYGVGAQEGLGKLQKKGIRFFLWNEKEKTIQAFEKGTSPEEQTAIQNQYRTGAGSFYASTLQKGIKLGDSEVTVDTILIDSRGVRKQTLAHEWLHLQLDNHRYNGREIDRANKLQSDYIESMKAVEALGDINFVPSDLETVKRGRKIYETLATFSRDASLAQFASLLEELDIHLFLYQAKMANPGSPPIIELSQCSSNLGLRAENLARYARSARAILVFREALSSETISKLEEAVALHEELGDAGRRLAEVIEKIASKEDFEAWKAHRSTVQMFEALK